MRLIELPKSQWKGRRVQVFNTGNVHKGYPPTPAYTAIVMNEDGIKASIKPEGHSAFAKNVLRKVMARNLEVL